MQLTLKVEAGQVQQSLTKLGEAAPGVLSNDVRDALLLARDDARAYPPERGDYVRTYAYYDSFRVEPTDYASWRLSSNLDYTRYVGGLADGSGQAWMHQGRWTKIADAVRARAEDLLATVERSMSELIRSVGLGL